MIIEIARGLVILFGLFIVGIGFLMLIRPGIARATLRKAGSTNLINYGEITMRMIIGIAMIVCADACKYPNPSHLFGWFLLITSLLLYVVPKSLHHSFSLKSAELIKPTYFQLIAPFAFLFGGLIIYNVL